MKNNNIQTNVVYDSSTYEIYRIIQQFKEGSEQSQRSLCCLLGSYAGDNLGDQYVFSKFISEHQLDEAIEMKGNGVHHLLEGQSTFACELATSLGFGLIETQKAGVVNLDCIAKYYSIWFNSPPIQMSKSTRIAFQPLAEESIKIEQTYSSYCYQQLAQRVKKSAKISNYNLKSSSSLVRIAPLIVYLSKQNDQQVIKNIVYEEQSLTQCNEEVLECSYIIVRACILLIQGQSAKDTFTIINKYVQDECRIREIKEFWQNHVIKEEYTDSTQQEHLLKHAFIQAFIILNKISQSEKYAKLIKREDIFKHYMKEILQQGGNTTSNAAICGALIGSYLKLNEFPKNYLEKIINCNLQDQTQRKLTHSRKSIYNPRNCIYLCSKLLQYAPNSREKIQIFAANEISNKNKELDQIPFNNNLKFNLEDTLKKPLPFQQVNCYSPNNNNNPKCSEIINQQFENPQQLFQQLEQKQPLHQSQHNINYHLNSGSNVNSEFVQINVSPSMKSQDMKSSDNPYQVSPKVLYSQKQPLQGSQNQEPINNNEDQNNNNEDQTYQLFQQQPQYRKKLEQPMNYNSQFSQTQFAFPSSNNFLQKYQQQPSQQKRSKSPMKKRYQQSVISNSTPTNNGNSFLFQQKQQYQQNRKRVVSPVYSQHQYNQINHNSTSLNRPCPNWFQQLKQEQQSKCMFPELESKYIQDNIHFEKNSFCQNQTIFNEIKNEKPSGNQGKQLREMRRETKSQIELQIDHKRLLSPNLLHRKHVPFQQ